ncbi:hypothetical protein QFZ23_003738 [Arthrobacter globiformis]|uniref:hypothetical protein n=1 Tax=Arthrobacter globiformis TaxID=1665 RepID=UPI00277D2731|nr:hypothetical protein [Arthrobacter globiformis]MDQ1059837.1 hypothetical protein [Arthrobacter globiformis]
MGSTLTAVGTWGPAPVTLKYQWYANGAAITGATASTYPLTAADLGRYLTVTVTGSKPGYATEVNFWVATIPVSSPPS